MIDEKDGPWNRKEKKEKTNEFFNIQTYGVYEHKGMFLFGKFNLKFFYLINIKNLDYLHETSSTQSFQSNMFP